MHNGSKPILEYMHAGDLKQEKKFQSPGRQILSLPIRLLDLKGNYISTAHRTSVASKPSLRKVTVIFHRFPNMVVGGFSLQIK
jgi:hypothetical protein